MDDPRLTPARGDLAAKYLEGKVKAARFVEGEVFEISGAIAPLREHPSSEATLLTQNSSPATKRVALTLPSRYFAARSGRAGVRRGSFIAFAQ